MCLGIVVLFTYYNTMAHKDKDKKREYERRWYKGKGKEKRKAANDRWKKKRREEFKEFKRSLKCIRCGEGHVACLDFHHKDPLKKDISIGAAVNIWSQKRLINEINKCEILCSNCHRKEHYNNSALAQLVQQ